MRVIWYILYVHTHYYWERARVSITVLATTSDICYVDAPRSLINARINLSLLTVYQCRRLATWQTKCVHLLKQVHHQVHPHFIQSPSSYLSNQFHNRQQWVIVLWTNWLLFTIPAYQHYHASSYNYQQQRFSREYLRDQLVIYQTTIPPTTILLPSLTHLLRASRASST
jgi:hypothetical protein